MTTPYVSDAIFWIEVEKISPNPYQPRREFDPVALKALSESIRMYGVLQPLVVTRKEVFHEGAGMTVEYELIAGERRLRASKLAGLASVPVLIRSGEEDPQVKLEMAIIENLQREDLNPVDRARSFDRLAKEFKLKQAQIADKVGKSREYVSNSMRILLLPDDMITALSEGRISEGHTRPLLMLADRPDEQLVLFKEIMQNKLTVREAESMSRRVATDKIRNKEKYLDPQIMELEKTFTESLGTRVRIEKNNKAGGTVTIDFFNQDDLRGLLEKLINSAGAGNTGAGSGAELKTVPAGSLADVVTKDMYGIGTSADVAGTGTNAGAPIDDRSAREIDKQDNEDNEALYSLKDFSV